MNTETCISKLFEITREFGTLMEEMINDAKNDSFKINKFTNYMENFCTDSIRNIRGF